MFWTLKLSFNVDILTFFGPYSKNWAILKQFSGHTGQGQTLAYCGDS